MLTATLLLLGCEEDTRTFPVYDDTDGDADTDADSDADADADSDADGDTDPPSEPVVVAYQGTVLTVAGTPFGFDDTIRTTPISGSFGYDLGVRDDLVGDQMRSEFDHKGGGGPFVFNVGGRTVTGSGHPIVTIELFSDTFRWTDCVDQDDGIDRTCSLDGVPDPAITIGLSFTPTNGDDLFPTDRLPATFPWIGYDLQQDAAITFSVEDGDTLLMALEAVTSP